MTITLDQITDDMKQAMRDKDKMKLSTLRLWLSDIKNIAIEQRMDASELGGETLLETLSRQVKRRVESAKEYKSAGRDDLAETEEAEAEILRAYMPPQMSEQEIREKVRGAIQVVGAAGPGDMGKVMGALMPQVKGKADGSLVNGIVKEELS